MQKSSNEKRLRLRILAGIALIGAGVLSFIISYKPELSVIQRVLVVAGPSIILLGGVGCILGGWKLALTFGAYGLLMIAAIVCGQTLKQPWNGIGSLVLLAVMFVVMYTKRMRGRRDAADPELSETEALPGICLQQGDYVVQLFKGSNAWYQVRLGNVINADLTRAISSEEAFQMRKGCAVFQKSDIDEVFCNFEQDPILLRIKVSGKTYRYRLLHDWTQDEAEAFFQEAPLRLQEDGDPQNKDAIETPSGKRLSRFYQLISILGIVSSLLFIFLAEPYALLSWMSILVPAAFLIVTSLNLNCWYGMPKKQRDGSGYGAGFFPAAAMGLRSLLDFNVVDWKTVVLPAVIVVGMGVLLFLALSFRSRKKAKSVIVMCLVLLCYAPFATLQLNHLLAQGATAYDATVKELADSSSSSGTSYEIMVDTEMGEKRMSISGEAYELLSIGKPAYYITIDGGLGIKLQDVYPTQWVDE